MKILFAMSAIVLMTSVGRSLPHIIPVPIVALALFTAVYLSKNRSAALVFFGGLFISDLAFGLHDLIPVVYASLVPVLFIGFKLRENLGGIEIARASVVSSLVYFLLTNLGVWVAGACNWSDGREIPPTLAGLVSTYSAAVPLLPARMSTDLLASFLLFGGMFRVCKNPLNGFGLMCAGSKANLRQPAMIPQVATSQGIEPPDDVRCAERIGPNCHSS
jgi:hypothetical protein